MLTIKVQKNLNAAKKYFEEHLALENHNSDYYMDSGSVVLTDGSEPLGGLWHGKLSKRLDLSGCVKKSDFDSILEGKKPKDGSSLTARINKIGERRLYFDSVFSAPKSISILGTTMGDLRLVHAHNEAVKEAFLELEAQAHTRVRVDGRYEVRKTSELLAAEFCHTTSRSLDPQLHTHMVILNATFDSEEQKFKALEAYSIYDQSKYLTEVYRSILHSKVIELGYETIKARYGFEIKGVSKEIQERFSKRSVTIKKEIERLELSLGRKLSNSEISNISHKTRSSKDKELPFKEAIELQKKQLQLNEINLLNFEINRSKGLAKEIELDPTISKVLAASAINSSCKHLFERSSVVKSHEILEQALKNYDNNVNYKDLKSELFSREDLIINPLNNKIGTKDGLAKERFIVESVKETKSAIKRKNKFDSIEYPSLNSSQNLALKNYYKNRDKYFLLDGGAGTGKSALISKMLEYERAQGTNILALSTTTKSRDSLAKDFGVPAMTLQGLLASVDAEASIRDKTLIIDEAGLMSVNQMFDLMEVAKSSPNSQIVFVGDINQHNSIEAGDALRVLKKFAQINTTKLSEVMRQKDPEYKELIQKIISNNDFDGAWSGFDKKGWINEAEDKEKRVDIFLKDYFNNSDMGKSIIAIAPTWKEIDMLTKEIRLEKEARNELSKSNEVSFATVRDLNFTQQEKTEKRNFFLDNSVPMVKFNKNVKEFHKNEPYRIIQKNGDLFAENESQSISFKPANLDPKSFNVLEARILSVSPGDSILLRSNIKDDKTKFINGEEVKVKSVSEDKIFFEDGRSLDPDFKQIEHAYVVTSNLSQGLTKDHVSIYMSQNSGLATNSKQFYVSASRGRESMTITTDDKMSTYERVRTINHRQSNLE
ncbi:MAG: conjugative relaxase-like TrwC/TraI family protein, partial [Thermoproteota archaeon]